MLYLHRQSSSCLEAKNLVFRLLSFGLTVVAFDFAGSGESGGDIISFGVFEADDITAVIKHIYYSHWAKEIIIWARGMGAVAGLLWMQSERRVGSTTIEVEIPLTEVNRLISILLFTTLIMEHCCCCCCFFIYLLLLRIWEFVYYFELIAIMFCATRI